MYSSKEFRELMGLTQSEFAEKFGIPVRTVQNWEYRRSMPYYIHHMFVMIIDLEHKVGYLEDEIKAYERHGKNLEGIIEQLQDYIKS